MASCSNKSEISPKELKNLLDTGANVVVLDIREPHELAISCLANHAHIPMGQLVERVDELQPFKEREIVVYCRSGQRSLQCAEFLRNKGYTALNLTGGILAWSRDVDSSCPEY